MTVTNAAAAALTERVRVFVNLVVLPMHPIPVVAKELATLDVLSGGRVTLGVGIGGREHDYLASGSTMERRHQRLDDGVAELRRLWAGGAAVRGSRPGRPAVCAERRPADPCRRDGAQGARPCRQVGRRRVGFLDQRERSRHGRRGDVGT